MELSNLPFEELIELRNRIDGMIRSYKDGYLYICKVRSYGRNWTESINNTFELEELCCRYDGQDGIVDVYSLLFEQMGGFIEDNLKSSIKEDINFWLPYILLSDVIVDANPDYNRVNISLNFTVTETGANQTITLQVDQQGGLTIA